MQHLQRDHHHQEDKDHLVAVHLEVVVIQEQEQEHRHHEHGENHGAETTYNEDQHGDGPLPLPGSRRDRRGRYGDRQTIAAWRTAIAAVPDPELRLVDALRGDDSGLVAQAVEYLVAGKAKAYLPAAHAPF